VFAAVIAFSLVYTGIAMAQFEGDSRVTATDWIESNVEDGATVDVYSTHHYLPGFPESVSVTRLPIFLNSGIDNLDTAAGRIDCGAPDYVVLSRFHHGRYLRNPSAFPDATAFFQGLIDGDRGYERVANFGPAVDTEVSTAAAVGDSLTPRVYSANPRLLILERTMNKTC
jgi:hypothetical protein